MRWAVAAIVLSGLGCVRYRDELVVLPDGSGKLTITVWCVESVREQFMGGARPEAAADLALHEGFVAWTKVQEGSRDGWRTYTVSGYFEDINKVKLCARDAGGGKSVRMTFAWRVEGDGWVLEIDDRLVRTGEPVPAEKREATWATLQPLLRGFELTRSASLPGELTTAEGYARKDKRAAWTTVSEADVKSLDDLEKLGVPAKRRVVCGRSAMTEAEIAAFRAEMAAAKSK